MRSLFRDVELRNTPAEYPRRFPDIPYLTYVFPIVRVDQSLLSKRIEQRAGFDRHVQDLLVWEVVCPAPCSFSTMMMMRPMRASGPSHHRTRSLARCVGLARRIHRGWWLGCDSCNTIRGFHLWVFFSCHFYAPPKRRFWKAEQAFVAFPIPNEDCGRTNEPFVALSKILVWVP